MARYWVIRPSECADNVSRWDGKSMCFAADEAAHAELTEHPRRAAHDRAMGPGGCCGGCGTCWQWRADYGRTA